MRRRLWLQIVAVAILIAGCTNTPSAPPVDAPGPPSTAAPTSPVPGSGQPGGGPTTEPVSQQPGSADLIEAAVAAGTLDDATGLLYRIFATYGDRRLPAVYATGRADEDVVALLRAPAEIDSLPPAIADQLRPYLARPTDPLSPFHGSTASTATVGIAALAAYRPPVMAVRAAVAAVTCDPGTNWGSAPGTTWIRVWERCDVPGYEQDIVQTLAAADALYRDESAYLGGALPNEDSGGAAQGGDTRIDIYLTADCAPRSAGSGGVGPSAPPVCLTGADGYSPGSSEFKARGGAETSSAFVLIKRSRLASPDNLRDTLAHELFHVFEVSFNFSGFLGASGATWFLEASATWAEWRFAHVVPRDSHGTYFFNAFQGSFVSLQADGFNNGYLSFGWPLFMEQQGGAGTVAKAWSAIAGQGDANAIMAAIDRTLPFEANFRIFGMRGWNEELTIASPVTPWLPAEPVSVGSSRARPYNDKGPATTELKGTVRGIAPKSFPGALPSLYARYRPFTVADDVGQVTLDFSGLSPRERLDVDALVKLRGKTDWERRELPGGRSTWCTDNPDDDIEQFVVVLSNHAHHLGEDIAGSWTVESPLEPCLSYYIKISWTDTWNGVADNVTFEGYADTINPDALGNVVMLTGTGTIDGSRAGWAACNPGYSGPTVGRGSATVQAVIDGDTVGFSAFADFGNDALAGVNTNIFFAPRKGTKKEEPITMKGKDRAGNVCEHGWYGTATIQIKLKPAPT